MSNEQSFLMAAKAWAQSVIDSERATSHDAREAAAIRVDRCEQAAVVAYRAMEVS